MASARRADGALTYVNKSPGALHYRASRSWGVVAPIAHETMRRPLSLDPIRSVVTACAILVLTSFAMPCARAATPAATDPNETCLACHGDKDAKSAGREVHRRRRRRVRQVRARRAEARVHRVPCGRFRKEAAARREAEACRLRKLPREAGQGIPSTVHGMARKAGSAVAATCADCHGTHDIKRSNTRPRERTTLTSNRRAQCHGNEAMMRGRSYPAATSRAASTTAFTARRCEQDVDKDAAPTCTNCHGAHDIRAKTDSRARTRAPTSRHLRKLSYEREDGRIEKGVIMASCVRRQPAQAPGCTDCHSAHDDQAAQRARSARPGDPAMRHLPRRLYGLLSRYLPRPGYRSSATRRLRPAHRATARTRSCRRRTRRRKCRRRTDSRPARMPPEGKRQFRAVRPACQSSDRARTAFFFHGKFMDFLLIGVFGFFGLHTVLWFYRALRVGRATPATERK